MGFNEAFFKRSCQIIVNQGVLRRISTSFVTQQEIGKIKSKNSLAQ